MPYYRATYDGYVEGEYDLADQARKDLMEAMEQDIECGGSYIAIEQFDEESQRWGPVKENIEEER